jgi:endonuclease IV
MAGETADSFESDCGRNIDRVLVEVRKDAEELKIEFAAGKREIIQEGLSDVAEVIDGLERLRQLLIK